MAELEEVSQILLRPAKNLADWSFDLAKTVEEYNSLIQAQSNINLNKAALVIQNTTATYGRRVEYLFQDANSCIQRLIDQEKVEELKKVTKKDGREKKNGADIIDFEPIDFVQYIGKNNNIKTRNVNSVKLLGQRFPELETCSKSSRTERASTGVESSPENDNDRDSGRRYNFRCNQYLTSSGMLVEHLTPEVSKNRPRLEDLEPSRVNESASDELVNEFSPESDNTEENFDGSRCGPTPVPDSDFIAQNYESAIDSGRGSSIRTTTRPESSLSLDHDDSGNWEALLPGPGLSSVDFVSPLDPITEESSQLSSSSKENTPNKRNTDEDDSNVDSSGEITPMKRKAGELESTDSPISKGSSGKTANSLLIERCRRSKRIRSLFDDVNTVPLQPIPFDGVPDKTNNKLPFKLPCPANLLKGRSRPKKRKIAKVLPSDSCLNGFLPIQPEGGLKKMTTYSPTRQLFYPYMKDEFDDIPGGFWNKHLRYCRDLEAVGYEAVTSNTENLLGYRSQDPKNDSFHAVADELATTEILETPDEFPGPESPNEFPLPETPESSTSLEPDCPPTMLPYSSRIGQMVHDLYESTNVRTEEEEAVVRWHQKIKLKLQEVEKRPKFQMADYTSRVMKSITSNDGSIEFDRMVRQDRPFEPARYLMAALMLANKSKLTINTSPNGGNLTLLLREK